MDMAKQDRFVSLHLVKQASKHSLVSMARPRADDLLMPIA
jgi:hypothetical protein